ncbi:MAG: aminoacyl-tRNA hydrolase [Bacteroidales bacterium]|nr:aminoacyl-tRNA hydrolase [Bacteroidales bacterium]
MAEYLIAGLGNIGNEYASTRHNMGFMTLDAWAQASNAVFRTARYGDVAEFSLKGRKVTLLKPSTYMNLSGYAVRYWVNHLEIPLENLLVICDDLNLPFGTIRMRRRGSCGGHNGLASIEEMLESQDYTRIRVGIGNEFSRGGQVDYVLGSLSSEEMDSLPDILERTIAGAKDFVLIGPEKAMNSLRARPKADNGMLQNELGRKKDE